MVMFNSHQNPIIIEVKKMAITITKTEFEKRIKDLEKRFGEIRITEGINGEKILMIVNRNKHAGTFKIKKRE